MTALEVLLHSVHNAILQTPGSQGWSKGQEAFLNEEFGAERGAVGNVLVGTWVAGVEQRRGPELVVWFIEVLSIVVDRLLRNFTAGTVAYVLLFI
jgi:hypothetical protein